jgi:hypothetical protein
MFAQVTNILCSKTRFLNSEVITHKRLASQGRTCLIEVASKHSLNFNTFSSTYHIKFTAGFDGILRTKRLGTSDMLNCRNIPARCSN